MYPPNRAPNQFSPLSFIAYKMAALAALSQIKNLPEIGKLMKMIPLLGDMESMNVRDVEKAAKPLIACNLAASYGELKEHLKAMDEEMKVMIGITVKDLNKNQVTKWDDVVSAMMQNPALEPMNEKEIHRYDKLIKESTNWFNFDGSSDVTKVR